MAPVARPGGPCVFVDTEFSSLEAPALLSVGAVTADGHTFYAELEQDRPVACSSFVQQSVLPLMDNSPQPRERAAGGFTAWLREMADGQPVRLISDSPFDRWALGELLRVEDLPDWMVWQRAPVAYSELDRLSEELRMRRHHALDDALVLRRAVLGDAVREVAPGDGRPADAPRLASGRG
jgi:hypothetical protein